MKLNPDSHGMLVNKKELAQIFGISERSFSEYQKDPNFPLLENGSRGESNHYDTAQVIRYLITRAEDKYKVGQSALAQAKTEQAQSDSALKRLQYHEKLGTLILKEDALSLVTDWARFANQQFRESVDRMILDVQSQFDIEIPKEMKNGYITTTSERVREFALKLGGDRDTSVRATAAPGEAKH